MANALQELFGNIAVAIREKTGREETMTPKEFPENIRSIVAGDGSKTCVLKDGSFYATGKQQTVEVDFGGAIPDILVIYPNHVPAHSMLLFSVGFSSALLEALGGGYKAPTYTLGPSGGTMGFLNNKGMELQREDDSYGCVRSVTSKSFTVGTNSGNIGNLYVNNSYGWFAITGLI